MVSITLYLEHLLQKPVFIRFNPSLSSLSLTAVEEGKEEESPMFKSTSQLNVGVQKTWFCKGLHPQKSKGKQRTGLHTCAPGALQVTQLLLFTAVFLDRVAMITSTL